MIPLVLSLSTALAGSPAGPTCLSAYGTTACGYHCEAAYGDVRCASTPDGACTASYGEVSCWDPAPRAPTRGWYGERRHDDDDRYERGQGWRSEHASYPSTRGPTPDPPRPTCLSAYGTTACGYGCVAAYGDVKCGSTPGATCSAVYGVITCSDDPWSGPRSEPPRGPSRGPAPAPAPSAHDGCGHEATPSRHW